MGKARIGSQADLEEKVAHEMSMKFSSEDSSSGKAKLLQFKNCFVVIESKVHDHWICDLLMWTCDPKQGTH